MCRTIPNSHKEIIPINKKQACLGLLFLFLGVVYYLLARSPDKVYAIHSLSWLYSINLYELGLLGNYASLISPSFMHSCAFSLLTGAFLPFPNKTNYFLVCLLWALIGCSFELGQFLKPEIPEAYFNLWGIGPLVKLVSDYFKYGTFDLLDFVLNLVGSSIAFIILVYTMNGDDCE